MRILAILVAIAVIAVEHRAYAQINPPCQLFTLGISNCGYGNLDSSGNLVHSRAVPISIRFASVLRRIKRLAGCLPGIVAHPRRASPANVAPSVTGVPFRFQITLRVLTPAILRILRRPSTAAVVRAERFAPTTRVAPRNRVRPRASIAASSPTVAAAASTAVAARPSAKTIIDVAFKSHKPKPARGEVAARATTVAAARTNVAPHAPKGRNAKSPAIRLFVRLTPKVSPRSPTERC